LSLSPLTAYGMKSLAFCLSLRSGEEVICGITLGL
jgi:hypothetical protein